MEVLNKLAYHTKFWETELGESRKVTQIFSMFLCGLHNKHWNKFQKIKTFGKEKSSSQATEGLDSF